MTPELREMLWTRIEGMREELLPNLIEFIGEDVGLIVSGVVFRPADQDDVEGQENLDEHSWWVVEGHFVPDGGHMVSNIANKVLVAFDPGMSYVQACQRLEEGLRADTNQG